MNSTQDQMPFFFKRKIGLCNDETAYVRQCLSETRLALVEAQQIHGSYRERKDLRNALTTYLVVLGEILAGRSLRYAEPLKPSVCMAAYLGHERILAILERNGVNVCQMKWDTLNVLFAAILGRRLRLVKHLLSAYPRLRTARHLWFGNAGAFCAAFGNLRILRFLRKAGFDLMEPHRFPRQPSHDARHFGSALLFAMRNHRTTIVKDLVAHGEFCPWQNLGGEYGTGTASVFEVAVQHHFFGVARTYLENGWLNQPITEDDFLEMLRRTTGYDDVVAFRFLEKAFPRFDAKHLVWKNHASGEFGPCILRHCGIVRKRRHDSDVRNTSSPRYVCDSIRHWIAMNRPNMVRFTLDNVPEVLPLVWPKWAAPIQEAFQVPSEEVSPCRCYLFRLARSLGISLFPDDAARRFWEEKSDMPVPWKRPLGMDEVFPFDEGLDGGYLHSEELRKKLFHALQACGAEARRLMDDPEIDPNVDLSWNQPFSVRLGHYADWNTYKGWLLRGMEVYLTNIDDPGDFPLASTPSIVRHLLPDLEHRPWKSPIFTGNTLVQAAAFGDVQAVKALLEAGCPVNFCRWVPGDEISPLRAALMNGHDTVARLLFARGGMNILNGVVYPVPSWISKPRPLDLPTIRRTAGDPSATPIFIDPIVPLPAKLSRLRSHWLEDAKTLNGNCLCLMPSGTDCLVFRFAKRLYVLRRESLAMDEHAFEASLDGICRDLESIGCKPIPL
ncbi:MAG: hypothetical protein IJT88_05290 [Kiritimatiellae bacterium]|nr:hypothetical protein [Kiritimatiellia bacterium]